MNATAALPRLRGDVTLVDVGTPGTPAWTLHDALRGRYVRIGWLEMELLARFALGEARRVVEAVNRESALFATVADVERLVALLEREELARPGDAADLARLQAHRDARRKPPLARLFHASLHARRSLVDPEPLLRGLARLLAPVLDRPRAATGCLGLAALAGLLLLQAHAHELGGALERWLTPAGAAGFIVALALVNVVHELGHGIAATRAGCRVRRMGIALIFLVPMAWCDTSDAWRLRERRARLAIDAGGIVIEAVLAVLALWAWLLLPDGPARAIALFVAVTSFATTLLVNLNPFMKFDGYFLLSDAWGVENLQSRSFEALRRHLRGLILGETGMGPCIGAPTLQRRLAYYAAATALYRLFLYLGIAWMVYAFWFKALGLVMGAATLWLLLVRPVTTEIAACATLLRRRRAAGGGTGGVGGIGRRATTSLVLGATLLALLVVPLPRAVDAPAVLAPERAARVYAPRPARLARLHVARGDRVRAGDAVATLEDPALDHEIALLTRERRALARARQAESGRRSLARSRPREPLRSDATPDLAAAVADGALLRQDARIESLRRKRAALVLRAPIDGEIVRLDESLTSGLWLGANAVLADIVSRDAPVVRAYVEARDLERLGPLFEERPDRGARFVPSDGGDAIELQPLILSPDAVERLADPMLATAHGGSIATVVAERAPNEPVAVDANDAPEALAPLASLHLARLATVSGTTANGTTSKTVGEMTDETDDETTDVALARERIGHVHLSAAPASLVMRTFERLYGAVLRESGF